LDESRFFDVIAQSNAKFWQSIGEASPVSTSANLPIYVAAQIVLERLFVEPSIVQFIKLSQKLKEHIVYTSNLPTMREKQLSKVDMPEAFINEIRAAFSQFNLDFVLSTSENSDKIDSGLMEDQRITDISKNIAHNFRSTVLLNYTQYVSQRNSQRWKLKKVS